MRTPYGIMAFLAEIATLVVTRSQRHHSMSLRGGEADEAISHSALLVNSQCHKGDGRYYDNYPVSRKINSIMGGIP